MVKKALRRGVLGKGLEALIPEDIGSGEKRVIEINLDRIHPGLYQPREDFNEEKLKELVASIKESGLIQPVIVRPVNGDYELIAGERRLRAVKELGLERVPAVIKNAGDEEALELSIVENIQRENLNPVEEAKAYVRLSQEFGLTQEDVARKVARSRTAVANTVRLLKLPEDIQEDISAGRITAGHAKAILMLERASDQKRLRDKIIAKGMSVRETEGYVEKMKSPPIHKIKRGITKSADLLKIEEGLQTVLGTKVRIIQGKKKGRLEIEYYSHDDLERIITIVAPELSKLW